jgi:hypothetical protein
MLGSQIHVLRAIAWLRFTVTFSFKRKSTIFNGDAPSTLGGALVSQGFI